MNELMAWDSEVSSQRSIIRLKKEEIEIKKRDPIGWEYGEARYFLYTPYGVLYSRYNQHDRQMFRTDRVIVPLPCGLFLLHDWSVYGFVPFCLTGESQAYMPLGSIRTNFFCSCFCRHAPRIDRWENPRYTPDLSLSNASIVFFFFFFELVFVRILVWFTCLVSFNVLISIILLLTLFRVLLERQRVMHGKIRFARNAWVCMSLAFPPHHPSPFSLSSTNHLP